MDTVICEAPGKLVHTQRPRPVRADGEVLVRVRRVGICGTDMHIYKGTQPFLTYPRVMGHELSGEVAEAPAGSDLTPGDVVYIMPYMSCGHCAACRKGKGNCCMNIRVLGVHMDGGLCEYISVPEGFVFKATGIGLDEAAMLEFLAIGHHAVRRAQVQTSQKEQAGQKALVVGVGPIGIATALFAKLKGAEVTVIDSRQPRIDFCLRELKADHGVLVGDDTRDQLSQLTGGDFYDVVFDATGAPKAMEAGFGYVGHGGTYVLISVVAADITFYDPEFHKRETTLMGSRNATPEDFKGVLAAMIAGHVPTAALNTHRAKLSELPDILPQWIEPSAGVIKALVEC
ncbi:zinc-binding alcohol dehydrogenase family protein [Asticcacaulis sp. ZE23SCel15]|uniref:zinc-binding alcohol dehydrogenase family protein n=1 Tax=Asticcacaulis sp. ZE23SCel15 TaxID=3059027 RepID=UPI00265F8753|nr:zinc-binding alcohol dehydrogenase family protein [Asticcacaulis sp. ZE23SCel15]WKL58898.1 zinc-binding alcohol dehydrogenase family protein [Asticcacaulis sp. ZE23SCel15]